MSEPSVPEAPRPDAGAVVADAIQDLTAARLARGFLPLALLFAGGVVGAFQASPAGWWTAGGALASSAVMLAYGLRTVQRALGRSQRFWMTLTLAGSVVPPAYGVYVLGWRGLRGLATGGGAGELVAATLFAVTGVWVLRAWMRIVEIERLARVMILDPEADGGHA